MTVQIKRGAPAVVTYQLEDQEGSARNETGAITFDVIRFNGTFGTVPTHDVVDGLVGIELTAEHTADLDLFKFTIREDDVVVGTLDVEIVGGYLFNLAEARASSVKLRNDEIYSDADLLAARRAVTEECEKITGRSFVPKLRVANLNGRGTNVINLPDVDIRRLVKVVYNGTPMATPAYETLITKATGELRFGETGLFDYGEYNLKIIYEYGMDAPPTRIKDAALLRLQSLAALKKSGSPDRAEYQIIEGKVFSLNRLRGGFTGIKDVDDAYQEWAVTTRKTASIPIR